MNFILKCPTSRFHLNFWTTVPVTTYWGMDKGKLVHSSTGKVWTPDDTDEWVCEECGSIVEVEKLSEGKEDKYATDDWACLKCEIGFASQDLNSTGLKCPHCGTKVVDPGTLL